MMWGFGFTLLHGSGDYAVAQALAHYGELSSHEHESKLDNQRQLRSADYQRHSLIFGSFFIANLICLVFLWKEVVKKELLTSKGRFLTMTRLLLVTTQILLFLLLLHPPFVESKAWTYAIGNNSRNPTPENQLEFKTEREFRATQANLTTLKIGIVFVSNLAILLLVFRQMKSTKLKTS
jgi:hypothetical protein